jgi:GntR family transcriptional regulator, transcriptional repressor for pyruvate dehydrogenase complex
LTQAEIGAYVHGADGAGLLSEGERVTGPSSHEPKAVEESGFPVDTAAASARRRKAATFRRTEKVSEVVAREIVRDSRHLKPGTMLPPEAKLLEQYRVSRASLREALRLLEVQGLVIIRPGPGGGPMIAEADSLHFGRMASLFFHMSGATHRDTLNARLLLEPILAGLIAEKQDPVQIQALKDYLENATTTLDGKLPQPSAELSAEQHRALEFHAMLMSMSGNPVLTLIVRSLQDLRVEHMTGDGVHPEGDIDHVHREIAEAIIEGRREDTEWLMGEHMKDFIEYESRNDPGYLEQTVSWR